MLKEVMPPEKLAKTQALAQRVEGNPRMRRAVKAALKAMDPPPRPASKVNG